MNMYYVGVDDDMMIYPQKTQFSIGQIFDVSNLEYGVIAFDNKLSLEYMKWVWQSMLDVNGNPIAGPLQKEPTRWFSITGDVRDPQPKLNCYGLSGIFVLDNVEFIEEIFDVHPVPYPRPRV